MKSLLQLTNPKSSCGPFPPQESFPDSRAPFREISMHLVTGGQKSTTPKLRQQTTGFTNWSTFGSRNDLGFWWSPSLCSSVWWELNIKYTLKKNLQQWGEQKTYTRRSILIVWFSQSTGAQTGGLQNPKPYQLIVKHKKHQSQGLVKVTRFCSSKHCCRCPDFPYSGVTSTNVGTLPRYRHFHRYLHLPTWKSVG